MLVVHHVRAWGLFGLVKVMYETAKYHIEYWTSLLKALFYVMPYR